MNAKLVEELRKKMVEKDPNNKKAGEPGAKLDSGKPPVFRGLLDYFPRALMSIAEVSEVGSKKYCWKGWETVEDGINRYSDAILRHMCKDSLGEVRDIDTNLLHKAHTAWGALAVLELYLREQEKKVAEPNVKSSIVHNNTIIYNTVPSQFAVDQINKAKPSFSKDADLTPGL